MCWVMNLDLGNNWGLLESSLIVDVMGIKEKIKGFYFDCNNIES